MGEFIIEVNHADTTKFRHVDGIATKRAKQRMRQAGLREVTLVDVDYGSRSPSPGRCVSVYHYEYVERAGW